MKLLETGFINMVLQFRLLLSLLDIDTPESITLRSPRLTRAHTDHEYMQPFSATLLEALRVSAGHLVILPW